MLFDFGGRWGEGERGRGRGRGRGIRWGTPTYFFVNGSCEWECAIRQLPRLSRKLSGLGTFFPGFAWVSCPPAWNSLVLLACALHGLFALGDLVCVAGLSTISTFYSFLFKRTSHYLVFEVDKELLLEMVRAFATFHFCVLFFVSHYVDIIENNVVGLPNESPKLSVWQRSPRRSLAGDGLRCDKGLLRVIRHNIQPIEVS